MAKKNTFAAKIIQNMAAKMPVVQELQQKTAAIAQKAKTVVNEKILAQLWKPESEPQKQAYDHEADEILYGGAAGGGKANSAAAMGWAIQNLGYFTVDSADFDEIIHLIPDEVKNMDSKVLMWDGEWKIFSALKVGDRLMNPDGSPQKVIAVHERGELESYELTFEDGTKVKCSGDHLWGFWEARTDSRRKTRQGKKPVLDTYIPENWNINYISRARIKNTDWLYERVNEGRRTFIIPICAQLNYSVPYEETKDYNPEEDFEEFIVSDKEAQKAYLYGALLGDGTIQPKYITLTSGDDWLIEKCQAIANNSKVTDRTETKKDLTIRDKWVDAWARNSGLMGKYSHNKFIPEGYLKESLEFRWNLAQGLFDTDGYASSPDVQRREVSYCTISPQLAEDVANLVRSLGFMAKIRQKQGICYTPGYEGQKQMSYIVEVEGNNKWRLFSLPRKVEAAKAGEPNIWVGKKIVGIEKIEPAYCRCITVSNPNGLYITDGYNTTHNSALLLILATTKHKRSVIFRREYPRLKDLIEKSRKLLAGIARYNSNEKIWRNIPGDRTLEFGAVQYQDDVEAWRGIEHDLKGFDELGEFTKEQYQFLITWNRSPDPTVTCKAVSTCNPPSSEEAFWIIEYWSPWLNPDHPNPALPGEIRWFAMIDGTETEVADGSPIFHNGEEIMPRSRTFIPARLEDNAYLKNGNYRGVLQRLPEPLRSQLLYGDFTAKKTEDHPWQVIPSDWVQDAMDRWTSTPPAPQSHLGVDVARGGDCLSVIAPRHHYWLGELIILPGQSTPDGSILADEIQKVRRSPRTEVRIDVVGVGSSCYDFLKQRGFEDLVFGLNGGGSAGKEKDKSGTLEFFNLRSMWIWHLREILDPKSEIKIALPPDPKLKADLCAPRWKIQPSRNQFGQIRVESKDEIIKRLGRSPDRGDAVMYAFAKAVDDGSGYDWLKNI